MEKNWYVVYTKPQHEKKIASVFTKRKIENFFPLNYKKIELVRRSKTVQEPLFKSYVFVKVTPAEIKPLREINGVRNILYWKDEPAVIKQDEIDAIKEFTSDRRNIELERGHVNMHDILRVVDNTSYYMAGNIFAVKHKALKIILPSLGYTMMIRIEDGSFFGREVSYKGTRLGVYEKARQQ